MENVQDPKEISRLQSVTEHLTDLRGVLFRSLIAVLLTFVVSFCYVDKIVAFLKYPLLSALPEEKRHLYYFGLTEQFYCYMKVALFSALVFSFPFLLFQLWVFILPALKKQERKLIVPFLVASVAAFVLGFFCAYRFALPYLYRFLIEFNASTNDMPMIRLNDYLTLTLQLLLGTALLFEIPVLLSILGKLGIINYQFLIHWRPQAYIGLTFLAAVLTPTPDAFSMILALIPLLALYELSVLAVRFLKPTHSANC